MKKYKYMLIDEEGKFKMETHRKVVANEMKRYYKSFFGINLEIKEIEE